MCQLGALEAIRSGTTAVLEDGARIEGYAQQMVETGLRMVLADHGVGALRPVEHWAEVEAGAAIALAVLPLEHGFTTADVCVLAEADIVGDRLMRPVRKARRSDKFIAEVAGLGEGDLVVHRDHGIGRFDGLITLEPIEVIAYRGSGPREGTPS